MLIIIAHMHHHIIHTIFKYMAHYIEQIEKPNTKQTITKNTEKDVHKLYYNLFSLI